MYALTDFSNFTSLDTALRSMMKKAPHVRTERWQGVPLNTDTRELHNVSFEMELGGIEDLDHWRKDCQPNLPWADDHFEERVGGVPLNPGVQWAKWPWGLSANRFRAADEKFNHTYMQRLWPKYAGRFDGGGMVLPYPAHARAYPPLGSDQRPHYGINHYYGDLWDLVELLAKEPYTRQAWIPLFHPEDTGIGDGGRKMCSLGYQFTVREDLLHVYYPLRSCDLIRHWRDDVYLAIRLLLWVLQHCRDTGTDTWKKVRPGTLMMHMTSLHVFESDRL